MSVHISTLDPFASWPYQAGTPTLLFSLCLRVPLSRQHHILCGLFSATPILGAHPSVPIFDLRPSSPPVPTTTTPPPFVRTPSTLRRLRAIRISMTDIAALSAREAREALEEFVRTPPSERHLTPSLGIVLEDMASTGVPCFEWPLLKALLSFKMGQTLREFHETCPDVREGTEGGSFEEHLARLQHCLEGFGGVPFTLQRLCELLIDSKRMYNSTRKLLLAFERVLAVSTTIPSVGVEYFAAIPFEYTRRLPNDRISTNRVEGEEEGEVSLPADPTPPPPPPENGNGTVDCAMADVPVEARRWTAASEAMDTHEGEG